jgi:hypothetical protein
LGGAVWATLLFSIKQIYHFMNNNKKKRLLSWAQKFTLALDVFQYPE